MKRLELKQILEKVSDLSRRYYRLYPTLYRDLVLWEDYLLLVEENRHKQIRALKERARIEICQHYSITDKTFYVIRRRLSDLCYDI